MRIKTMTKADKKKLTDLKKERKSLKSQFDMLRTTVMHLDISIANQCGASHAVAELQSMIDEIERKIKNIEASNKGKIKFLMYAVTNGVNKVKVSYSSSFNDNKEIAYITVYDQGYSKGDLGKIFGDENIIDETDIMTDYFDDARVKIYPDSPHWAACKAAYEKRKAARRR